MNTNTNQMNPEATAETEEARGNVSRETRDDADNATAAVESTMDEADEQQMEEAQQITTASLASLGLAGFGRIAKIAEAVQAEIGDALEAIRADANNLAEVAELSADAADARKDLWANTLAVVEAVADATADAPEFRGLVYSFIMEEFMSEKTRSTAKAYASTARNVLIKLVTKERRDIATIKEASYADVRKMLNPPSAEQTDANARLDGIKKQLAFIARNAAKYGGEATAARLDRIAAVVEKEYNPVFRAKEADSPKEKQAREVADLRQSSPRESGNVETSAPKPAAHRTLHKGPGQQVNARH
jgi:hypothetical protein